MSEEENGKATSQQLSKICAVMHRLAEKQDKPYDEVRKQFKEKHGFSNFAKLSPQKISEYIDELEKELNGKEEAGDCDGNNKTTIAWRNTNWLDGKDVERSKVMAIRAVAERLDAMKEAS